MHIFEERRAELKRRRKLPVLEKRREATQATIDRFRGKAFDWTKNATCAHLARFHLRQMGKRPPAVPKFRGTHGAKAALKSLGCDRMDELLDKLLPRISPAEMMLGDLCVGEDEGSGLQGVMVCTGPRRVFGWMDGSETPVMVEPDMRKIIGAWRA